MRRVLGVDIGGMSIKCAIVDENGKMSDNFVIPMKGIKSQEEAARKLSDSIKEKVPSSIKEIGIGCPGSIDSKKGVCLYSNNLGWRDFPICSFVSKSTGREVRVSNDANAAMLGEINFGAAKGFQNAILLTLGTGVGSGLFLNGHLFEGEYCGGAELGHSVIALGGRDCTCGRKGCLESYISATALIKDTKEAMGKNPQSQLWKIVKGDLGLVNGETAFEGKKMGDGTATKVINDFIYYFGEGVLNFISVFRPGVIVIGGGLSGQKDALINPLKNYLHKEHYGFGGDNYPPTEIVVSSLGNAAGIVGAAAEFFHSEQID